MIKYSEKIKKLENYFLKKDLEKELEFIKSEIDKKWFFTINSPKIPKKEEKNPREDIIIILSVFSLYLIFYLISYFWWPIWNIILIIIFCSITILIVFKIFKNQKFRIYNEKTNFSITKNTDILAFEKLIFINWKFFEIDFLEKNFEKIKEMIISSYNNYYFEINDKNKNFYEIRKNFLKLELISQFLEILNKHIYDEIEERNSWDWKDKDLENSFSEFDKKIKNIFEIKNKIEQISKNIEIKNFFDFQKFDNWLIKKTISSLNWLKNILEKQIFYCENILKIENSQNSWEMDISKERIKIQKNALEKQISAIDEKIKRLEN